MRKSLFFLVLLAFSAASRADGPTPYPDPKDEAAWPGKGPIRCFPWMVDNRKAFWQRRDRDQGAVVFVGDSLTGGWKPELLAEKFPKLRIANRGIGGDTSRGVRFRFQEDVLDLKPRAIMLLVGGNDLSAHGDPAATAANISAMLDAARAANPKVPIVLCLRPPAANPKAPYKPGAAQELNDLVTKVGEARDNLVLLDLYTAFSTADGGLVDEYYAPDKTHLSKAGYEKWAEMAVPAFEKLGIK